MFYIRKKRLMLVFFILKLSLYVTCLKELVNQVKHAIV